MTNAEASEDRCEGAGNLKFDRFEIVEWMCETPKGDPALNEDRLIINDRFVAVVDGATVSGLIAGVSGGIVAARAVADALEVLPADATVHEFVDTANALLSERTRGLIDASARPPFAAVAVWSRARKEIWRIGDCHFRIDEKDYIGEKEVDRVAYAFRCGVVRARLALGLTTIEAERKVATLDQPFRPLAIVQHAFMNSDSDDPMASYGAINGSPIPHRFIEIIDASQARQIVLCSDGFVKPYPSLREAITETTRLSETDPLLVYEYDGSRPFAPGRILFDDATYVRFGVSYYRPLREAVQRPPQ
jgi:hypothetical protein